LDAVGLSKYFKALRRPFGTDWMLNVSTELILLKPRCSAAVSTIVSVPWKSHNVVTLTRVPLRRTLTEWVASS
jgi:hypothetical protein